MEHNSYRLKMTLLSILCLLVFLSSFFIGRFSVGPWATIKILLSKILPISQAWTDAQYSVVINIRLPRVACAFLIGASLSVAGCAYQGMFRNPMASPDILGSSAGSGFGAALAIVLGSSYFGITLCSFIFGLVAVLLSYFVSKASKIQTTLALVLSGIVIGSLCQGGTSLVKLIADTDNQLPAITYWLMGSLASVQQKDFLFLIIPVLIGLIPVYLLRWRLNLLTISEAEAQSMGVNTSKLRLIIIVCTTLMTSACVAVAGVIGWIGLVVPHFCRLLIDDNQKYLIPSSAIFGATFLMALDNIARTISSSEIPIGILSSFIGAPIFIYLIITGGNKNADKN